MPSAITHLAEIDPPPAEMPLDQRIAMTCSCRDADDIPKVPGAGQILQQDDGLTVQIMHNGLKVLADGYYGAWMTKLIERMRGHHEPQEEAVFHALIRQLPAHATMLEVGSYWSYYSLWFMSQHPAERRAYAIEPDPEHLRIGLENSRLNGLPINFEQGFIAAEEGEARPFPTETSGIMNLRPISVSGLMDRHHLERIDLILCDAQGGEIELLKSLAPKVQEGRIGCVMISTHAVQITGDPLTHQKCLAMVKRLGGEILLEHDVHESFSGDGLILAHFGLHRPEMPENVISRNRYSQAYFRNPIFDLAISQSEINTLRAEVASLREANKRLRSELDALAETARTNKRQRGLFPWLKV